MSTYGFGGGYGDALLKGRFKPKPRNPRRGTSLSIEDWARQQVEKFIAAQVAAIEAQRGTYLDELRKESELEARRGQELAQALQAMDFPGRIQGIYGNASSDISGLAQGFSGQTRDIASTQAAEQANMLSGTGQEGAVRSQGESMGNVLFGTQGYSPARSLTETGAAYGAQAALEPSFAARIGQREAAELHREGLKGLSDFTNALIEARSQKPGMIQDLIKQRQEAAQGALDDQRDYYLKLAALELSRGNAKRADEYLKLANQDQTIQNYGAYNLDPSGNPKPGFHYELNPTTGNQQLVKDGWHLSPKGKPVKDSSGGGKTPDWGDIQRDMAVDMRYFTEDIEIPDPNGLPGDTVTQKQKISYEEAYQRLWTKYSGLVKNKARLRRLIQRILVENRFKKTGPGSREPGNRDYPGA